MKKQNNIEKGLGLNLNLAKVSGSILTAVFLTIGTASFAQERENVGNEDVDEFSQYDANQDQQWDRDEFDTRMNESGTYDQWDTDRSGDINEDEFNEGTRNWQNQQNQGDNIQNNTTGTTGTTGANDLGTFQDWDRDQSGSIDQNEYNQGNYDRWDTDRDGVLNSEEYNGGINTLGTTGTETEPGIYNEETETETPLNDVGDTEMNNEATETETEVFDDAETGTELNDEVGTETETQIGAEGEIDSEVDSETEVETEY